MKNLNTVKNRIFIASAYEQMLTSSTSNTYLGIARPKAWTSSYVPEIAETTATINELYRNLIALKKINSSDINLVIPRIDWRSKVYTEYTENVEIYSNSTLTAITGTANAAVNSTALIGSSTTFSGSLLAGDLIVLNGDSVNSAPVTKKIISIANNTYLTVNSAFSYGYVSNTVYKLVDNYPSYANEFYVRNTRDQVFKCLHNNYGGTSTDMPEININGDLPENPYIITSDGYKWKYMYTIPPGMKEKFFTSRWMPVILENIVTSSAVNGRIDIVELYSGGNGYLANGTSTSAQIINVVGDGTGANLTATIANGVITGINILNGGQDYTYATISIVDALKVGGTANANVDIAIGPQYGHGFDAFSELGATNLMISVDLSGTESSTIPTTSGSDVFDYRQIALLRNPQASNGAYLSDTNYKTTHVISVTPPPARFRLDETVYQGTTLGSSTFSATVVNWDSVANELWVNNLVGNYSQGTQLIGTQQTTAVTAFTLTAPSLDLYTGEVLYIENRDPVYRDTNQTEQVKIVLSF